MSHVGPVGKSGISVCKSGIGDPQNWWLLLASLETPAERGFDLVGHPHRLVRCAEQIQVFTVVQRLLAVFANMAILITGSCWLFSSKRDAHSW